MVLSPRVEMHPMPQSTEGPTKPGVAGRKQGLSQRGDGESELVALLWRPGQAEVRLSGPGPRAAGSGLALPSLPGAGEKPVVSSAAAPPTPPGQKGRQKAVSCLCAVASGPEGKAPSTAHLSWVTAPWCYRNKQDSQGQGSTEGSFAKFENLTRPLKFNLAKKS